MTAHILFPQIDPDHCSTLSPIILKNILREALGFEGVLITDSLTMQGVLSQETNLQEVVFKAFEAGNDILLIGGRHLHKQGTEESIDEVIEIYHSLVEAVRKGRISEERVNSSVTRILKLKRKAGLFKALPAFKNLDQALQVQAHINVARQIAQRSIKIEKGEFTEGILEKKMIVIAPALMAATIRRTDLLKINKSTTLYTFVDLEPSVEEIKEILERIQDAQYIVFCSYNAWKFPKQLDLLNQASSLRPTALIAVRDPWDLDKTDHVHVKIATYSPTSCSLQIVAEYLQSMFL